MKKSGSLYGLFFAIAITASIFVSCSGVDDNRVPEGVLRLFADKTEIAADGSEQVVFRVMFGSKDVSNELSMNLISEFRGNGGESVKQDVPFGVNTFSTSVPGEYVFTARYYSEGAYYSDNSISIKANASGAGTEKDNYRKYIVATQFTSVWCQNCPLLGSALKQIADERPGVLLPVSFHMDFNSMKDPFTVPYTAMFGTALGGIDGIPLLFLDMRDDLPQMTNLKPVIDSAIDEILLQQPDCGVALSADYDEVSRSLTVDVKITSNVSETYRVLVMLVEDGLEASQAGSSEAVYVHDNVVRSVLSDSAYGVRFNENLPLSPGIEASCSLRTELDAAWDASRMRVVAAAMVSDNGGKTYHIENANSCRIGGSARYELQ